MSEFRIGLTYYGKPETRVISANNIKEVKEIVKKELPDHKLIWIKTVGKKKMNFYNPEKRILGKRNL